MANHKTKPRYSKVIVAACLVFILAFTVTCLVFYWNAKSVDPVLVGFFFACFGMEFASLAFVTRGKLKYTGSGSGKVGSVEVQEDEQ